MKSQNHAVEKYRARLAKKGMARFEVVGLDRDRDLIRSLARKLSEDSAEAVEVRAAVGKAIAPKEPSVGGILAALRRSPLVGADLDLSRPRIAGRKVDL